MVVFAGGGRRRRPQAEFGGEGWHAKSAGEYLQVFI